MNFPQYHAPEIDATPAMYLVPAVFGLLLILAVIFVVSNVRKSNDVHDGYDQRAGWGVGAFYALILIGALTSYFVAYAPHYKAIDDAKDTAMSQYRADVVKYIDYEYGVKITKASARDLLAGRETAGVAPTNETITLSLLNRDQKTPVLIGTDHNPIPKFERIK